MIKRIFAILLLGCFALSLCGCGECKHSWTEADCTTASVCSKCGEAGSEALGHSWVEATCQAPETCSVCGITQGAVLEHVFGGWSFLEETMTRSCENCALEVANAFSTMFGFDVKNGNSSVFAGTGIEVNKSVGYGKNGHIAIKTANIARATAYLERIGVAINWDSAKKDANGNMVAVYLASEFGGFAVHLLQAK